MADDEGLAIYSSEGYTDTLAALVGKVEPAIILVGATAMGRDLGPRLAARLGVGLASDCIALEIDGGRLLATRPIFAGKALAKVKLNGDPQMATVRPNVLAAPEPDAGATATVEPVAALTGDVRAKVVDIVGRRRGRDRRRRSRHHRLRRARRGRAGGLCARSAAWPRRWARRWAPPARRWTPAGSSTPTRWARPARR